MSSSDALADTPAVARAHATTDRSWASAGRAAVGRVLVKLLSRSWMVLLLGGLVIAASVVYREFLTWGNIRNILDQNAPVGIIAVAMTFIMIGGGFDLSVGAIFACASVVFANLANGMPTLLALAATLLVGGVIGALNGVVIAGLRVNPFVATLGSASILGGAAIMYSHSAPVTVEKSDFTTLGRGQALGLPISVWILAATFALGAVVLRRTVYGHYVYAIGGNQEASRLAGLRVNVIKLSTYAIGGLAAAIAGAIFASRVSVGQGNIGGTIPLQAIAIVVIGGTSLFGGEGSVGRTAIGISILAVLNNVSDSKGWGSDVEGIIQGAVIIAAVAIDAFVRSRRS